MSPALTGARYPEDGRKRRVAITGASRGLGKVLLDHFRLRGWEAHGIARSGADHLADVTDPEQLNSAMQAICAPPDGPAGLDVLICCASRAVGGRLSDLPRDEALAAVQTDLAGTIAAVHCAQAYLRLCPGATVVLINSFAAFSGIPGFASYSAAKAAINALAQALRLEWEQQGPGVLQVFIGAIAQEGDIDRPAWNAAGRTWLRPMRPLLLFNSASLPIPPEAVANRIAKSLGRSEDLFVPRGLFWMDALARHLPGLFRILVRTFYRRRMPGMLGEVTATNSPPRAHQASPDSRPDFPAK